ncbi:MAG: D-alanine--D-alanine ligase family protein [Opitutales bacterium]
MNAPHPNPGSPEAPPVVVLYGGVGPEREVSLGSGPALAGALSEAGFAVDARDLKSTTLPRDLEDGESVVFPALHGPFGEDGTLQRLLEDRRIDYAGCGPEASHLCMHKADTKATVAAAGVSVPDGVLFEAEAPPEAGDVVRRLGPRLVLKPEDQGSSVGLFLLEGTDALAERLRRLDPGRWLIEPRIMGRELSIGVLEGRGLGIVELFPVSGVYDFASKYTAGRTRYDFPARLAPSVEEAVRSAAETAFRVCGCRDFARVDFMLPAEGPLRFLEINTLPGLTPTSLLPKSASCLGWDFPALAAALVAPAVRRFRARRKEVTDGPA